MSYVVSFWEAMYSLDVEVLLGLLCIGTSENFVNVRVVFDFPHSIHNRSFQSQVCPENRLHWYLQPHKNRETGVSSEKKHKNVNLNQQVLCM